MNKPAGHAMNRRDVLKTSVGALGAALLLDESVEAYPKGVNTNSSPSDVEDYRSSRGDDREARTKPLSDHSH